jgi:beta-galactosidase
MTLRRSLTTIALGLSCALAFGQSADQHPDWPGKGQLFVGTCYQPVDRSPEQIRQDIALMKRAGFTMVRMGDLSWDAFEPSEGQFEFAWFDQILEQVNQAGIKVVLDIGGSPAPIWLHHKYPSVNLVNEQGATVQPAERYMDDISSPDYRERLIRFADELTWHYTHNPALAAIGYNNEIGNGVMSYSEADRQRFIEWLQTKYGTIANLNKAWDTQHWSRHLNSFDEVQPPYANGPSPPERYLVLRRYWSDVTISVLEDLEKVRQRNVPNLPAVSNLWDTAGRTLPEISLNGQIEKASIGFYEVLETHTAIPMAAFTNTPEKSPAITANNYGKAAPSTLRFRRRCRCSLRWCAACIQPSMLRRDQKLPPGFTRG